MPFRVIKHRTRKAYKGTRRSHSRRRRGGGHRSVSPARARSKSRSRSRSRSPLPDSYPEDIKQFVGNVTYGYKIFSDDDGNYTRVELINLRTLYVVGDLKDMNLIDPIYMTSLENGIRRFSINDWDIDHDLDQGQLNNIH